MHSASEVVDHDAYTLQVNVVCELHVSKLSLRKDYGEWEWEWVKECMETKRENAKGLRDWVVSKYWGMRSD